MPEIIPFEPDPGNTGEGRTSKERSYNHAVACRVTAFVFYVDTFL